MLEPDHVAHLIEQFALFRTVLARKISTMTSILAFPSLNLTRVRPKKFAFKDAIIGPNSR
jgi:hypothetical protein